MSRETYSDVCEHKNQVIDDHEGTYVCLDCAKVIDNVFVPIFEDKEKISEECMLNDLNTNDVSNEIAHRLNIPNFIKTNEKKNVKSISNVYIHANKNNFTVTLKEMSAVSGFSCKQIGKEIKNTVTVLDIPTLLEKYCKLLEIDYKTYTVIKDNIYKHEQTGHNPLTVVASHIYFHMKSVKKKLSMKNICDVVGISSISIQRYIKKLQ